MSNHVYGLVSRPTPKGSVRKVHYSVHDKTENEFLGSFKSFEEAKELLKRIDEDEKAQIQQSEGADCVPVSAHARGGRR